MRFRRMLGTHMKRVIGAAAYAFVLVVTSWTSTAFAATAQPALPLFSSERPQRPVPQFTAADWAKWREHREVAAKKIDWSQIAAIVGTVSTAFAFIERYLLAQLKTDMLREIDARYQPREL